MTPFSSSPNDRIAIDTLRFLAIDMVERAKCGHPGAPMGLAPVAYLLWSRILRYHPASPSWPNRDRFVLSCGHASALLYGLLHLSGFDLPLAELERFRQLHSKTPGHPERGLTPGVETTTGPLGQGLGNAVGMAIAERLLAERFNRDGLVLFDHRVWVLASDGDIMEGVASEASSLAGHLALGRLNVVYDSNQITIDGPTSLAMSEDTEQRYLAYGWHTQRVDDGNDLEALNHALVTAHAVTDRPSLIVVRTHIGYGSPNKQDTADAHGAALGAEEVRLTKQALGWPLEPEFHVPAAARLAFQDARDRGARSARDWQALRRRYSEAHPAEHAELERRETGTLPEDLWERLPEYAPGRSIATRKASGDTLNALKDALPELVGGSADLTGSNNTFLEGEAVFSARGAGRNFHFGVREHAMGAALNGMALSGLLRPYGGTFLIFSDYLRPALRLSALMRLPVVWVFTHDSIFLGEDGPTHQPIAHLAALRAIPNLTVVRPADANETAAAWRVALHDTSGPTALVLSRQGLPVIDGTAELALLGVEYGAYVLRDAKRAPDALVLATGSEVALAIAAQRELEERGAAVRVVSMPSWERFARQDEAYRESVLPSSVTRRLAIEAATPLGWERWVGPSGDILGIDRFGASAPHAALAEEYGFTPAAVVARLERMLAE